MKTRKLEIACPLCGSKDVSYSCTPNCCFNHVCTDCGATFEPVTVATGKTVSSLLLPEPLPDPADPTVQCVRCESIAVYLTEDGQPVCANCKAVLQIELTEICPG
jgi:DNA-directed RNA polymerase subunit RPC12/RpoP